jgi:hypothetical protein
VCTRIKKLSDPNLIVASKKGIKEEEEEEGGIGSIEYLPL